MKLLVVTFLQIFVMNFAIARDIDGGEVGNGGDMCENRFQLVRNDIASWIGLGGSAGLALPDGVSLSEYNTQMMNQILTAKITCVDSTVMVGKSEKTCKNFMDQETPRVVCNRKQFLDTNESDQYVLVHHEYAGLARIEVAHGEESDYAVSNQITGFLVDEVVKKLAVAPKPRQPEASKRFVRKAQRAWDWTLQEEIRGEARCSFDNGGSMDCQNITEGVIKYYKICEAAERIATEAAMQDCQVEFDQCTMVSHADSIFIRTNNGGSVLYLTSGCNSQVVVRGTNN